MNIVVCIKRVPDPEAPATQFRIDEQGQHLVPARSVPRLTSTYDESALEAALRLRDQHGGTVTLLSVAAEDVTEWLAEAMATGADAAVIVRSAEAADADGLRTAATLAAAIRKLGDVDLVLCGRQASDTDGGIVGPALAELLDLPSATIVRKVEAADGALRVERVLEDGYEVLEVRPPAVLTITSELLQLRYATMANIMAASMKQVTVWDVVALGKPPSTPLVRQRRLLRPEGRTECRYPEGDPQEAARALAQALRAGGVV